MKMNGTKRRKLEKACWEMKRSETRAKPDVLVGGRTDRPITQQNERTGREVAARDLEAMRPVMVLLSLLAALRRRLISLSRGEREGSHRYIYWASSLAISQHSLSFASLVYSVYGYSLVDKSLRHTLS
jgi:hypothetical protein